MALEALSWKYGSYADINSGAHRMAASIVGMPALVRHLGFWNVDATATERAAPYREYIGGLRALIRTSPAGPLAEERDIPSSEADLKVETGTATLIRFRWHGLRTTVRLEYHREYITLTSILDLSFKPRPECTACGEQCPRRKIETAIGYFEQLFHGSKEVPSSPQAVSECLQSEVWKEFEKQVIDLLSPSIDKFGQVFLDSRGIVTGSRKAPAGATGHELRSRFAWVEPRDRIRRDMIHDAPPALWAQQTLEQLWPFIECDPRKADPEGDAAQAGPEHGLAQADLEFTATGFLDGRVLFVTALGPQPPDKGKQENQPEPPPRWTPIRYFLHAYTDDEWELGRLVDRINALGTTRLAAIMEIVGLRTAEERIERLSIAIRAAGKAIRHEIKVDKASGEGSREIGSDKAGGEKNRKSPVRDVNDKMNDVSLAYDRVNKEVNKDIKHRLERSKYYFEQFTKECTGLREQRVGGFQMYSEFVTRRMSGIFSYIQYLRTRMESLDSDNSSIERQFSWLKIASVTSNIEGVVDRLTEQDSEIAKIQEFGEFALIGALIPYYVGYAIEHTFKLDETNLRVAWIAVIITCIFICLLRLSFQRRKIETGDQKEPAKEDARKRLRWVGYIFVGYLAVVLTVSAMAVIHPSHGLIGGGEIARLLVVFAIGLTLAILIDMGLVAASPLLTGAKAGDRGSDSPAGNEPSSQNSGAGADGGT